MLALVAVSLLANTPLEAGQAFWKAHCALMRGTHGKAGRKKWEQSLAQLATFDFQIFLLGDHFAEPVEESQDLSQCEGQRTFKARVTEQTATTAKVMIAAGFADPLTDTVELLLVLDKGTWRIDDCLPLSVERRPRPPLEPPADFTQGPAERARGLYELYLPSAEQFSGYPEPRRDYVLLGLRSYLTRPFMMRLLTGPHPNHDGYIDELICFAPSLEDLHVAPALTISAAAKGTVTVTQPRADGGTSAPAQLHFVKQDVWRLDEVTCPAGRLKPE